MFCYICFATYALLLMFCYISLAVYVLLRAFCYVRFATYVLLHMLDFSSSEAGGEIGKKALCGLSARRPPLPLIGR